MPEDRRTTCVTPIDGDTPSGLVKEPGRGLPLRVLNWVLLFVVAAAALSLFIADSMVTRGYRLSEQANARYLSAKMAAIDMEMGSDYLTDKVRCFVVTGQIEYLQDFFEEAEVTRRRDRAVDELGRLMRGEGSDAYQTLAEALRTSNELMEREYLAMRCMAEANDYDETLIPSVVMETELPEEARGMDAEALRAYAREVVFDGIYMGYKDRIRQEVAECTDILINASERSVVAADRNMYRLLAIQTALTTLLTLAMVALVVFISTQVRKPLKRMVQLMRAGEPVPPSGARELRFVTQTYNEMLEKNRRTNQKLTYEASHDSLTGLYNRSAYDMLLQEADLPHIALVLVDVDEFKSINDTHGHDVGDRVLRHVAEVLKASFRAVDVVCRIGGDEFVVIMTRVTSATAPMLKEKIERINRTLAEPVEGLPVTSLSVGAAFGDRLQPGEDLFKKADTALYRVKQGGRKGCAIHE